MYSAIVNDRVDFVKIFDDNGCDMSQFLTYRRLTKLFNDVTYIDYIMFTFLKFLKLTMDSILAKRYLVRACYSKCWSKTNETKAKITRQTCR